MPSNNGVLLRVTRRAEQTWTCEKASDKRKTVLSMYKFPQTTLLCTRSQTNHNGSVKAGEWFRRTDTIRRCGLRRRLISFTICKHTEASNQMSVYMDGIAAVTHSSSCNRRFIFAAVHVFFFFSFSKGRNNIQLPLYVMRERPWCK